MGVKKVAFQSPAVLVLPHLKVFYLKSVITKIEYLDPDKPVLINSNDVDLRDG